jgi:hypothetical protein
MSSTESSGFPPVFKAEAPEGAPFLPESSPSWGASHSSCRKRRAMDEDGLQRASEAIARASTALGRRPNLAT